MGNFAPMSYERFAETVRAPGNGLGDIYSVGIEARNLRPKGFGPK